MSSSHSSESLHAPEQMPVKPQKYRDVFHYVLRNSVEALFQEKKEHLKWFQDSLTNTDRRNALYAEIKNRMWDHIRANNLNLPIEILEQLLHDSPTSLSMAIAEKLYSITTLRHRVNRRITDYFSFNKPLEIRNFINAQPFSHLERMTYDLPFLERSLVDARIGVQKKDEVTFWRDMHIDITRLSPDLQRSLSRFRANGLIDEESVLQVIHAPHNPSLNHEKKRELLAFLLPTVSVALLYKHHFLTTSERDVLLENAFREYLHFLGVANADTYLDVDSTMPEQERHFRKGQYLEFCERMRSEHNTRMWRIPTRLLSDTTRDHFFLSAPLISDAMKRGIEEVIGDERSYMNREYTAQEVQEFAHLETQIANVTAGLTTDGDRLNQSREMAQEFLRRHLTLQEQAKISAIDDFGKPQRYMLSRYTDGDIAHWYIEREEQRDGAWGVRMVEYDARGVTSISKYVSYADLARDGVKEIRKTDVQGLDITTEPEFQTADEYLQFSNRAEFQAIIDQIDHKNIHKNEMKMQEWLAFSLYFLHETHFFRILHIDDTHQKITLQDSQGTVGTVTWANFIDWIDPTNEKMMRETGWEKTSTRIVSHTDLHFNRKGNLSTFQKFAQTLGHGDDGGFPELAFYDNALCYQAKWSSVTKPLWGFVSENGKKHLEVIQCPGDTVKLVEYVTESAYIKWGYGERDAKSTQKTRKIEINTVPLSTEFLAEYLVNEKYVRATDKNPLQKPKEQPEKKNDENALPNNNHWERKSRLISGWTTVGAIMRTIKMGGEIFENKIESAQRRKAAETLYKIGRMTGNGEFARQTMSYFANNIGELIDKRISHLEQLSGEPRRYEIKKILLRKPPIAYDLMAAMIVTVKMSWHLYPDSLLDELQGKRYLWLEQLCLALGYNPTEQIQAAIAKEKAENTSAERIPETTLITRFLKTNSGNNPYIQALRGGSKYWGAVAEGRNGQIEKGAKEVKERQKASDRKQYIMSKFKSNEFEIVVGAFPELWGIDASPASMTPAFTWSMSNATRVAHPEVIIKMSNANLYGKGLNFHALPFSRDAQSAFVYQKTVVALVDYLSRDNRPLQGTDASKKIHRLMELMKQDPYGHNPNLYVELGNFWDTYHHILHPILQGAKPDLFLLAQELPGDSDTRKTIDTYIDTLSIHTNESMKAFNKELLLYDGYDYDASFIFQKSEDGQHTSLAWQLNHFKIETDHVRITKDQNKLWKGSILPFIRSIRTDPAFRAHPAYQREQFRTTYMELMQFIKSSFTTMHKMQPDAWTQLVQTQSYFQDLHALGFNLSYANVFESHSGHNFDIDDAYSRFLAWVPGVMSGAENTQSTVQRFVRGAFPFWGTRTVP